MEPTIRRLTQVLGASGIESAGHDTRFVVNGETGGVLQVSIEGSRQWLMAVLKDAEGVARCTVDLGPITHVSEDPAYPHRVTLHIGKVRVHLDGAPGPAIEVVTSG